MIYAAVAAVVNFFMMFAVMPVAFRVNCRFSLNREYGMIHVTKFGFNVATVKIAAVKGKTRVEVNGKRIQNKKNDKNRKSRIPPIVRFVMNERLVGAVYALGLVGGNDAAACAIKITAMKAAYNLFETLTGGTRSARTGNGTVTPDKCLLVPDFDENRLDLEIRTAVRISPVQAVRLIYLLKK